MGRDTPSNRKMLESPADFIYLRPKDDTLHHPLNAPRPHASEPVFAPPGRPPRAAGCSGQRLPLPASVDLASISGVRFRLL